MLHHRRGKHRSERDSWRSLKLFLFYRLSVSMLIFALPRFDVVTGTGAELFTQVGQAYLIVNLTLLFPTFMQGSSFRPLVSAMVIIDILAFTLLSFSATSLGRDFGLLIIPSIAGASLLLPGIRAPFFAALATLAVLCEVSWGTWLGRYTAADFPSAGIQGILYFAVAILAGQLARKAETSEALAAQRGRDLRDLATLNAHIIERMHAGVLVVGDDGEIRLANQAALRLLGKDKLRAAERLAGIAPELDRRLRDWFGADSATQSAPVAISMDYAARFVRLGNADQVSTLVLLDDLREHTRQVRDVKLAALGRLTASIAHEIRNPLGAMSHAAQLLLESEHLDAADTRLTRIIQTNAGRMNGLIQNILDLTQRREPRPEPIALDHWLAGLVDEFRQVRKLDADQLKTGLPARLPAVAFDPAQLHQILWNLLTNAERHARVGGQPRLRIEAQPAADARVVQLDIVDNGPGVPGELEERLFEPFFTTAERGTGLGLYIARELSENNRGRLEYRRTRAGESCFRLTLPFAEANPENDEHQEHTRH
ncbi:MAG: PAS domain-containing sensor histidine kinase [Thiotrichales bacterium]